MNLRPYQHTALDGNDEWPGIRRALADHRSTLLVLPTGTGKTTVFSTVIEEDYARRGRRALVLAHRTELLAQARNRLLAGGHLNHLEVGIEQAESHASRAHRVVVASVQTLHERRLATFDRDEFGLVVVDEAHHIAAPSYARILEYFSGAKVLGVTATPDRADGAGLGRYLESVAYVYEIRDAIADGFLAPLSVFLVEVEGLDLSACRTTAGDLNEADLEAEMETPRALVGTVVPALEKCGNRPTLVFAAGVRIAYKLADAFNERRPGSARAIDGTSSAEVRAAALADFQAGRFQFLVNVGLLTEGVDIPCVQAIVMARPTSSRSLYAQMAGRGTRLFAGKTDCLLLDITGNSGRHRLVCGLDILDSAVDENLLSRAKKKVKARVMEVDEALREAEHEIAAEKQLELAKVKVSYRMVKVEDQFTLLGIAPRAGRWGGKKVTDGQLRILQNAGIKHPEKLDAGQASSAIDAIFARRRAGLCNLKQAAVLNRAGLTAEVSFERASWAIDKISANGWRVPVEVLVADDFKAKADAAS